MAMAVLQLLGELCEDYRETRYPILPDRIQRFPISPRPGKPSQDDQMRELPTTSIESIPPSLCCAAMKWAQHKPS